MKDIPQRRAAYSSYRSIPEDLSADDSANRASEGALTVKRSLCVMLSVALFGCLAIFATTSTVPESNWSAASALVRAKHHKKKDEGLSNTWVPQVAVERCDYVIDLFEGNNVDLPHDAVAKVFAKQSVDANVFFRATAEIFWKDYAENDWDSGIMQSLNIDLLQSERLKDKDMWTWVTGDQHLSNFGAFHNRRKNVVFSVNDFDEAAIYDFHIDVLRLAVSIYNHATTNSFSKRQISRFLETFTKTYVKTVIGYVGNEEALDFELTTSTAKGVLKSYLEDVENDNSHEDQLEKYTDMKGSFLFNERTRLEPINEDTKAEIRRAFSSQQYGATMMKTGWHVPEWDDNFFAVTDAARRLGSGVGSFGVDRYYVLLNGTNDEGIVLDVKYEPEPAVAKVLSDDDKAWYDVLFRNEAARAIEGQRKLTSYVDPFTGWIQIHGDAHVVRQKSPWKDSPNLDKMTDAGDFDGFIGMVAMATATSHTRGTQGKAPGEFKHVIGEIFGDSSTVKKWGKVVARIAEMYHEQALLDYQCFKDYVDSNYPVVKEDNRKFY